MNDWIQLPENQALISLPLAIFGFAIALIFPLFSALFSVIAIGFGIAGVSSKKRAMAITGLFISIMTVCYFAFSVGSFLFLNSVGLLEHPPNAVEIFFYRG